MIYTFTFTNGTDSIVAADISEVVDLTRYYTGKGSEFTLTATAA